MIHYQLRCKDDHGFDGWFKDSASFDLQAKRGLLECPTCGSTKVQRALMTPSVPKKGREAKAAPRPPAKKKSAQPVAVGGERMPDQVRSMLQKLRSEVEKNCDYVGAGIRQRSAPHP